jgi:hypothetical protein
VDEISSATVDERAVGKGDAALAQAREKAARYALLSGLERSIRYAETGLI